MHELGDFTTDRRVAVITAIAIGIGIVAAYVAKALLALIALFTNVFFYGRITTAAASPVGNHLGLFVIVVPIIGALIIGVMARYGSERIRGHGIPEAIEAILINGSRIDAKVALLKPLSSAISIGSGGPFGAEGPIIMTGGACGSLIAQFFHLTAAERKTLLVAGAAAGMSATFAAPVAAVLLAVELLLFEWKPRSFIPVALASATAASTRRYIIGLGPLFPVPAHPIFIGPAGLVGCIIAGLLAGALSAALTYAVYASEDLFQKLPIHWMWWPAIGALFIGIGGWYDPRVLGVGYDTIHSMLRGELIGAALAGLLITKAIIWSVALGSGTSGGVLAPLLIMGGALGALAGHYIPQGDSGMWALIGMAAMMGGTMRSPLTAMVFAVEVTHDYNLFPALFIGSVAALGVTVLLMKRSILTEKLARRGHHITREYSIDPFELVRVRDVMDDLVPMVPAKLTLAEFATRLNEDPDLSRRQGTVVVDEQGRLTGMITRGDLFRAMRESEPARRTVAEACSTNVVVAYPEDSLHAAVMKMLDRGVGRLPVVEPENPDRVVGYLGRAEVLAARSRLLEEEHVREASGPVWGWGVGRRRLKQS